MPEIIFNGPEGRLEGRYSHNKKAGAPIALILHPLPQLGGNMNNPVTYRLYHQFVDRGFTTLRFNSRGIGRSQGSFDEGVGELSDAASALDWLQALSADAPKCWIAGYSFGAWIGMQLLMRRPEIEGFISIAPPANFYDFTFLAPCPTSGLIVHGSADRIVPKENVLEMVERLQAQKGITIDYTDMKGANHFFDKQMDDLDKIVGAYLDQRMQKIMAEN